MDTDIALGIQRILILWCSKAFIYSPMLAQHQSMVSTELPLLIWSTTESHHWLRVTTKTTNYYWGPALAIMSLYIRPMLLSNLIFPDVFFPCLDQTLSINLSRPLCSFKCCQPIGSHSSGTIYPTGQLYVKTFLHKGLPLFNPKSRSSQYIFRCEIQEPCAFCRGRSACRQSGSVTAFSGCQLTLLKERWCTLAEVKVYSLGKQSIWADEDETGAESGVLAWEGPTPASSSLSSILLG